MLFNCQSALKPWDLHRGGHGEQEELVGKKPTGPKTYSFVHLMAQQGRKSTVMAVRLCFDALEPKAKVGRLAETKARA